MSTALQLSCGSLHEICPVISSFFVTSYNAHVTSYNAHVTSYNAPATLWASSLAADLSVCGGHLMLSRWGLPLKGGGNETSLHITAPPSPPPGFLLLDVLMSCNEGEIFGSPW